MARPAEGPAAVGDRAAGRPERPHGGGRAGALSTLAACTLHETGMLARNSAVLGTVGIAVATSVFFGRTIGFAGDAAAGLVAVVAWLAMVSPTMVAGPATIAMERFDGTLSVTVRAGVPEGTVLAAKAIAATGFAFVLAVLCFAVGGIGLARSLQLAAVSTAAYLPATVAMVAIGTAAADSERASALGVVVVLAFFASFVCLMLDVPVWPMPAGLVAEAGGIVLGAQAAGPSLALAAVATAGYAAVGAAVLAVLARRRRRAASHQED